MSAFVILLSGGLDSTVLTYKLLRESHSLRALTVLYGQKHSREEQAARTIAEGLALEHRVLDLGALQPLFGANSALIGSSVAVPEGHYEDESMRTTVVPNRNMILLSVAAAWSVATGSDGVAYAAHSGDHAIYPDCREEFAAAMASALALCDYKPQQLLRPFVGLSKAGIVKLGINLGAPLERTWSCYVGGAEHCGRCGTCVERREAFHLAGVTDPTIYLSN